MTEEKEIPKGWYVHPYVPESEREHGKSYPQESYTYLTPEYKFHLWRPEGRGLELLSIHCTLGIVRPYQAHPCVPVPNSYINNIYEATEQIEEFLEFNKNQRFIQMGDLSELLANELDIVLSSD